MKIYDLKKKMGDFSLHIEQMNLEHGMVHGLVGSNGCGKTTLSKLLMGILTPDGGRIDYEGLTLRDITMTSQKPYLLHDTVYQNLIYPLKIRNIKPDEEQARQLLARCGLWDKRNQYARSMSSGEQQKLSFIRALIFHPGFIIVDETLSNLDPDSTELFEQMILEQQERQPVTWLVISHQLVHIRKICDRVHFMERGHQLAEGTPEEILLHPEHPAIRRFMASTEVSYRE
ncbi:MAG: ATP-binding cassette domain-containing protein [Clostridium sp.]|jgi:ABC-type multidrug transport system ATPase subunit